MHNTVLAESFGTLSQTINGLIKVGYTVDFNVHKECLICLEGGVFMKPEDFQIDKLYRFEGQSNPEDQSILYAISSPRFGIKGLLVNGYGISADEQVSSLVEKLQTNKGIASVQTRSSSPTLQRPEGPRVIDAAFVEINLPGRIYQLKQETTWRESDRNALTIYKTDTMRIVLMGLHRDGVLKSNKVNGVLTMQVIEGKIKIEVGRQQLLLEKGQLIALQANIVHSVVAIEECFFLITIGFR